MTGPPLPPLELDAAGSRIEHWMAQQVDENPVVAAFERIGVERRWLIRIHGEEKDVYTVFFDLRQRNLHVESFLMPAPEENHGALFEHLLKRNAKLSGLRLAIGDEEAVFLMAERPAELVDDEVLDELLGLFYTSVEVCFRPALRIGFASRFAAR